MWDCPTPDPEIPGAGFPILNNAVHTPIWQPKENEGGYNHHSQLVHFNGQFYAMWSNGQAGEDAPGQRILLSMSKDGRNWSKATELLSPLDESKPFESKGRVLTAFAWVILDGKLYAIIGCHEQFGFMDPDGKEFVDEKTEIHINHARRGYAPIARQVHEDGSFEVPFHLWDKSLDKPLYRIDSADARPEAASIKEYIHSPEHMPPWDFCKTMGFPRTLDDKRLCEPTVYRAKDGKLTMLLRDIRHCHRMFVSEWNPETKTWMPAYPTDIPDSPSQSRAVTTSDGTVLLVGNQMAPRFDNEQERRHYGRDPMTVSVSKDGYHFTSVFALRCGQQPFRFTNVGGRGGGAQYPDAKIIGSKLYVLYSMGKEDIWVSEVELGELGL